MSRIGILGGTFDPPHFGHLRIAEAAIEELELDRIIFVPAGVPPHKQDHGVSAAQDRLAMLELALTGRPEFMISKIELGRHEPSYTLNTLRQFRGKHPEDTFYFIIGSDNICEMESWHHPEMIFQIARVAATGRPGFTPEGKFAAAVEYFKMKPVDISSTRIREKVKAGESISGMLPATVEQYIIERKLYRSDEQADSH